jgi:hypothetical protein
MATLADPVAQATQARRLLLLRDHRDVARTLRSPSSWFWGRRAIELGAAFGTERQRGAVARRMTYWLSVCGCQFAAFLALAVLAWWGWSAYEHGVAGLWSLAEALSAAFAAAMAAKLAAVMLSRGLFVLELLRLLAIAPVPAPEVPQ